MVEISPVEGVNIGIQGCEQIFSVPAEKLPIVRAGLFERVIESLSDVIVGKISNEELAFKVVFIKTDVHPKLVKVKGKDGK